MILGRLKRRKGYSCHQVLEVLQSYLDGEVDESVARSVILHLDMCEQCAHEAELFRRIQAAIAAQANDIDAEILDRLETYAMNLRSIDENSGDPTNK
ncbi:MAG: zf-HC2 domain-containing protein [Acidimicrobiales bacterium]